MKSLTILQLYPKDMNIYGDSGNILTLKKRLEWRGIEAKIVDYNLGDNFDELATDADIIVGGGGQDSGQAKIHTDLRQIGPKLKTLADEGKPMLVICGLYQLFGHSFVTSEGKMMGGIGIFDMTTIARQTRLTGNVVATSPYFGQILGYENHSGQTKLGDSTPLATIIRGAGNNEQDDTEGARYKNVIGSYLHGSLLPKNPKIADFLIKTAFLRRFPDDALPELAGPEFLSEITKKARQVAKNRPR